MSDEQIIQEILSGNKELFKVLVQKYQNNVFRTAMGFTHSAADAEDITQDVFLQVFRSLHTFRAKAQFSTWIYRITLNISINHINKNNWRIRFVDAENNLTDKSIRPDDDKNPIEQLEMEESNKIIRQAINQLPEKQKKAFVLSKYDDLSQREIAEILETTEGAVEQLLQRAKVFLRKKLATFVGK